MNRAMARMLTCLYPRQWRQRYGAEFEELLQASRSNLHTSTNVVWSALREYFSPTAGGEMDQHFSFGGVVCRPSAVVPLVMSFTALAVVLGHIAIFGAAREPDEGAAAHIWQLLMGLQLPILLFFAIKWLPRAPRQTLIVLGIQAGAALASMAPVFFFNL